MALPVDLPRWGCGGLIYRRWPVVDDLKVARKEGEMGLSRYSPQTAQRALARP